MLFDSSPGEVGQGGTAETEHVYSIAVFGQNGQEIGQWDRCTQIQEEPDRISFIDDRDHLVMIRGGIIVLQEQ